MYRCSLGFAGASGEGLGRSQEGGASVLEAGLVLYDDIHFPTSWGPEATHISDLPFIGQMKQFGDVKCR
jgi:hypothetical protein